MTFEEKECFTQRSPIYSMPLIPGSTAKSQSIPSIDLFFPCTVNCPNACRAWRFDGVELPLLYSFKYSACEEPRSNWLDDSQRHLDSLSGICRDIDRGVIPGSESKMHQKVVYNFTMVSCCTTW